MITMYSSYFARTFYLAFFLTGVAGRLLDTSVSCDQNNFILNINFDAPFAGLVYSEEGFPNCVYVNGTMLSHKSYQLKIPLFGCETRLSQERNYENAIIIQESTAFLQSTDKKYLLTCIPATDTSTNSVSPSNDIHKAERGDFNTDPSGLSELRNGNAKGRVGDNANAMITVDFGGVTVDSTHTTTEIIRGHLPPSMGASSSSDLKYAVEIRAGHSLDSPPIANALNIGDPITYMVRLQKPVATSQLGRCWASDAKSQLELADERGCSIQPKGNIWGSFEKIETDKEVIFMNRIKAWAFPSSNEVNIFCNLRVCMSRFCSFSNCSIDASPDNASSGRQRRHHFNEESSGEVDEIETLEMAKIRLRRELSHEAFITEWTENRMMVPAVRVGVDEAGLPPSKFMKSPLILPLLLSLTVLLLATFLILLLYATLRPSSDKGGGLEVG